MPALRFEKPEERFNVSIIFDKENYKNIIYKKLNLYDINIPNEIIVIDIDTEPFKIDIVQTNERENHLILNMLTRYPPHINHYLVLLLIRGKDNEIMLEEPLGMAYNINTIIIASPYLESKIPLEPFYFSKDNESLYLNNLHNWDIMSIVERS